MAGAKRPGHPADQTCSSLGLQEARPAGGQRHPLQGGLQATPFRFGRILPIGRSMSVEYGLLERWRYSQMCQSTTPNQPEGDHYLREIVESCEPPAEPRANQLILVADDR